MKSKSHLKLRTANINDLSVLEFWQTQPHVTENVPDDEDWNWKEELTKFPEWREMLIAEVDQKPIGFLHIIDPALEETHYWGDIQPDMRALDIWIGEKDYIGKGYGTQMMTQAFNRCFKDENVKGIIIDPLESNVKGIRFYERMGFKFIENRNLYGHDCSIYQLDRSDWQTQYHETL